MADNATSFGRQAAHYLDARPTYPGALFDWVAAQAPAHTVAWDMGTGQGQAAVALSGRFDRVFATDIDAKQIAVAPVHPRIDYRVCPAEATSLSDGCADAITAATSLHWFDWDHIWTEIARVAKPGAVFCAWTYHRGETDTDVEAHLLEPIGALIAPYWSDRNRLSWDGYDPEATAMPFAPIEMPSFGCDLEWTPRQIAAFAQSWSAYKRATEAGLGEALKHTIDRALSHLKSEPRSYRLPLHTIAARVE